MNQTIQTEVVNQKQAFNLAVLKSAQYYLLKNTGHSKVEYDYLLDDFIFSVDNTNYFRILDDSTIQVLRFIEDSGYYNKEIKVDINQSEEVLNYEELVDSLAVQLINTALYYNN